MPVDLDTSRTITACMRCVLKWILILGKYMRLVVQVCADAMAKDYACMQAVESDKSGKGHTPHRTTDMQQTHLHSCSWPWPRVAVYQL